MMGSPLEFITAISTLISPETLSLIPTAEDNAGLFRAFQNGTFTWNDILLYGLYLIRLLIELAGLVAIIMVMLGGYRYIMPTEDAKEQGRDSLQNALIGFALVVFAWAIVDALIAFLTS
jgi:uncharacterized membrane protein